jgi:hypothetical protein
VHAFNVLYAVNGSALRDADDRFNAFRRFWTPHLSTLATEVARGKYKIDQGRQHD